MRISDVLLSAAPARGCLCAAGRFGRPRGPGVDRPDARARDESIITGHHSWSPGPRDFRARRAVALGWGRFNLPTNSDPVVAEQDMPPRVDRDTRHAAFDTALPWRHRTDNAASREALWRLRRPGGSTVALQTDRVAPAPARGRPCVGVVARHATKRPRALPVAPRLHEPDRLEPGQCRIVGPDLLR